MAISEPEVTTYVRYSEPGILFPEDSARKVSSRDPQQAAREAPASAFAFTFFDRAAATAVIGGREVVLRSGILNETKRYYIDAELMDTAAVEALPGDHSILLSNMRGNRWKTVVRCRTGNFQPLEDGDVLVSTGDGDS